MSEEGPEELQAGPGGAGEYPDADRAAVEDEPPPSARVPLSRERVIAAALAYIDDNGLPGLTMRRLGEQLGVEAMALYRYVPSKEDLLDAVVETLVADVRADDVVVDAPQDGWQDFLQRLAHGVRRMALAHPKAFPLVASRPAEAPWLRPPLRSLQVVETFLSGLLQEGFSDAAAIEAYRAYTSFLLGHLLLEVAVHGADVGPLDVLDDQTGEPGTARYPTVAKLREPLSEDRSAVEFEEALEALLDRLSITRNEHLDD
ncbi:TetR/AcrR family transcriptional regulator C-terminal domain-containing protein [Nocardioides xinjiangensis]|uniref:TetR/AcrR family transcriptional regulator C-terminal domain-containing protein n=1 Tax=Nocardioides xinjiangensis TaxID=2817376 RepID=UPI001B313FEA|nr:TetR/AcrR family transcriptional regulator C-terminal domain-containing protein [Nocardioides sp. SYSU D00778]